MNSEILWLIIPYTIFATLFYTATKRGGERFFLSFITGLFWPIMMVAYAIAGLIIIFKLSK